ncbi:NADH:flavin oxidoreductase [Talaromyces proteolyticus]|uniref:NADH:flavin oxidoreductase n=1 Tax=Talaromyces proteolyticus TaxID=1131652 RepID=A0AAD4Q177_9EURO|nr:NADH:flavin oxidoreductase [Talaromyces proteolyticus]KAH8697968.1 NADH:flavin oxidoreductase [Talaromyces proteolyticus]
MELLMKDPIKLPCGLWLQNRLVKAAMAEDMADSSHLPHSKFLEAYGKWAKGGWGGILTGNIQVDVRYLGNYNDLAIDEFDDDTNAVLDTWRLYANRCQEHGTPVIAQISHPGRQSRRGAGRRGIFTPTIAPSPIPLYLGDGYVASCISSMVFGKPREMSINDIKQVIHQFVNCARILAICGFSGIELHAAHGFLLSQFLSPRTNRRLDEYGGSNDKRVRIVLEIIKGIREVVPSGFCIGVKFNSSSDDSSTFEDSMRQIGLLVEAGIDFLEISGGTFEDPIMMGRGTYSDRKTHRSHGTLAREAFFWEYAVKTRKRFPNLILMLTGGFRSRQGIEDALQNNVCDLVGIGRPAVINPAYPRLIMTNTSPDHQAKVSLNKVATPFWSTFFQINALGGGAETFTDLNDDRGKEIKNPHTIP